MGTGEGTVQDGINSVPGEVRRRYDEQKEDGISFARLLRLDREGAIHAYEDSDSIVAVGFVFGRTSPGLLRGRGDDHGLAIPSIDTPNKAVLVVSSLASGLLPIVAV